MRWATGDERGSLSIEAALIVPLLMLIVLFAAQLALIIIAERSVSVVAEHTADVAASYGSNAENGRRAAIEAESEVAGLTKVDIQIQMDASAVTVDVTAEPIKLLPVLAIEVSAQAVSPLERSVSREERR